MKAQPLKEERRNLQVPWPDLLARLPFVELPPLSRLDRELQGLQPSEEYRGSQDPGVGR